MWAQMIEMRLKPSEDIAEVAGLIKDAEQPGSGLVRSMFMRDEADPSRVMALVVFESEAKAREREQDPRRAELLGRARAMMAEIFEGPPMFTDLNVVDDWTGVAR